MFVCTYKAYITVYSSRHGCVCMRVYCIIYDRMKILIVLYCLFVDILINRLSISVSIHLCSLCGVKICWSTQNVNYGCVWLSEQSLCPLFKLRGNRFLLQARSHFLQIQKNNRFVLLFLSVRLFQSEFHQFLCLSLSLCPSYPTSLSLS